MECGSDASALLKLTLQHSKARLPSPAAQEGAADELIRIHRLSSLCAGRARFFALTRSPSPTRWERGVGAHGGAPCSAFPLPRPAGEGNTARLPVHACAGKIAPASAILCRTNVPLSAADEGNKTLVPPADNNPNNVPSFTHPTAEQRAHSNWGRV